MSGRDFIGRLVFDPDYVCHRCLSVTWPIHGWMVAVMDVDGTSLDVEIIIYYLDDMLNVGGGCECIVWLGEGLGG